MAGRIYTAAEAAQMGATPVDDAPVVGRVYTRAEAEAMGAVPVDEDPAQTEAGQHPLMAAGEAFVRGVTGGFGESPLVGLEALNNGKSRAATAASMGARREANPVASVVGNVAGAIATAPLMGSASVFTKAGLAQSLARGSFYGLGGVVSESTLKNVPLSGEMVAAGIASGAGTDLAVSTVFGGLGRMIGALKGTSKVDSIAEGLNKASDEVLWRTLVSGSKKAEELLRYKDDIIAMAREAGVDSHGVLNEGAVSAVQAAKQKIWAEGLAPALEAADARVPLDHGLLQIEVSKALDKFRRNPVYDQAMGMVDRALLAASERPEFNWSDLYQMQATFRDQAERTAAPAVEKVLGDARRAMRDAVERAVEKSEKVAAQGLTAGARRANVAGSTHTQISFRSNIERYASASELDDLISKRVSDFAGQTPLAAGMKAGAMVLPAMVFGPKGLGAVGLAAGGAAAKAALEPRAGLALSNGLRKLASSEVIDGVARNLQGLFESRLVGAGAATFRVQLDNAAGRGSASLLAEHARIASSSDGPAYLGALGLAHETPDQLPEIGQKIAAISAIQRYSDHHAELLDRGARAVISGSRTPPEKTGQADFATRAKALSALVADPERAFHGIPAHLPNAAPAVMASAMATVVTGAKFLLSKAPKDPNAGRPVALTRPWKPSPVETARWFKYVDAVEHPTEILARGHLSQEHLEALQAVYPEILAESRQRLMEQISKLNKPLDYQRRLVVSRLLPGSGMSQPQMLLLQTSHATVGQGRGPGPKPDGRQQVDSAKNQQTQAQRLEGR